MRLVHRLFAGLLAAWPVAASLSAADDPLTVRGKVDLVTVYRGQALVTRTVDVPGPAGLKEIVVTELPDRVQPGSLFAEALPGIEIRSVGYRVRPVSQDVRKEIRELDAQLRTVQDALAKNQRLTQLQDEHRKYLAKLEAFAAPTASVELTKGVLNAETLKQLTAFIFEERKTLVTEELKLRGEFQELNEKQDLLKRQRDAITGSSDRTVQEAVVFVNLTQPQGKLHLRYLVDSANWAPSYNVRTDAKRESVEIEYNASIQQMSGEDWTDVAMTLSTATPSLVARAPSLSPLTVTLTSIHQAAAANQMPQQFRGDYVMQREALQGQLKSVENARANREVQAGQGGAMPGQGGATAGKFGGQPGGSIDTVLNGIAGEIQVLDLVTDAKVDNKPGLRPINQEGVSVTYALENRTSLPSRSDRQLIQIASLNMKADFSKVAVPVLTNFVYDEAVIVNSGKSVLLAGPASAFVAGQFVGHGEIPTVSAGEKFTVGFGIDTSLRATRELMTRSEQIQGGNRVVSFSYRLAIENFGGTPAQVRIIDRLPNGDQSQVKVTLATGGPELSKDESYLSGDRKKGLLRYDVQVPAQAVGTKSQALEYQFQVEYDKQLVIADLPAKR